MAAELPLRWFDAQSIAKLDDTETNCYRLAAGQNAFVDWWAGHVVISAEREEEIASLLREMENQKIQGVRSIHSRILKNNPGTKDRPKFLKGSSSPGEFDVLEIGMRYSIHLGDGYSAGLFPDQRENRMTLRKLIAGRSRIPRLLNLFSYTCAFSVVAAKAGALTTSVDLSRKSLEVGKSNFTRNAIPTAGHKFVTEDVCRFLPRLIRRKEKFDFIVLDPPTFARGGGGRIFRFERDFPELLRMAVSCAAPRATLLLSGNWRSLSLSMFRNWAKDVAPGSILSPGIVPSDFQGSPCSSTCWMHLP